MDLTKTGRFKRVGGNKNMPLARTSNPGLLLRQRSGAVSRWRVRGRELRAGYGLDRAAKTVAFKLPVARIAAVMGVLLVVSIGVLLGVNAYAQSKQINVRIDNGIITADTVTTARTVGELLAQNRVALGPNDEVNPPINTRLKNGMSVAIDKAMIVFITSRGEMQQVYMTGGTVQDALSKAQIDYDQDDEISPAPTTKLRAGLRIKHVAVENVVITEMHRIPHETYYVESDDVARGKYEVSQRGSDGVSKREIQVTYRDGVEVNRVEISNMITTSPKDRIILKGTQVPVTLAASEPTEKPSPSRTSSPSKHTSQPTSTPRPTATRRPTATPRPTANPTPQPGKGIYDDVTPADLKIPTVPSSFESIMTMTITAYTHTGRKTACGTWPQYTRTLKKPGTIAVDPSVIPYGTLLYVTGYGYCVAEDTGVNTGETSRIGDVFMNTENECYKWGRRRDVKVYVVAHNFKR